MDKEIEIYKLSKQLKIEIANKNRASKVKALKQQIKAKKQENNE